MVMNCKPYAATFMNQIQMDIFYPRTQTTGNIQLFAVHDCLVAAEVMKQNIGFLKCSGHGAGSRWQRIEVIPLNSGNNKGNGDAVSSQNGPNGYVG